MLQAGFKVLLAAVRVKYGTYYSCCSNQARDANIASSDCCSSHTRDWLWLAMVTAVVVEVKEFGQSGILLLLSFLRPLDLS